MAKQDGLLQFNGTIGNLSFYKTRNGGFEVRKKSGVSPQRIATDPKFAMLRANGVEFGQAGRAGKLIRAAFGVAMKNIADRGVSNRLTSLCKSIIKSDTLNEVGKRQLLEGELSKLEKFEFNALSPLDTSFLAQFTHAFDRAAGTASINIPVFNPAEMVIPPSNATHFRIRASAAALNFGDFKFISGQIASEPFSLGEAIAAPINLSVPLPPNSTDALLVAISIEFIKEDGNHQADVLNSAYNAMRLVGVNVAP
ncbi:hypothetical protein [Chitinophaga rhizosphaerae]|uniref:hypothetical protein n=1 Tax=Chitinophaga rhizosphaerae TaxID=1864947 RepID=UPI000F80A91D|nr:hypothetical protein [Chitinophaga rhizosphaerae]